MTAARSHRPASSTAAIQTATATSATSSTARTTLPPIPASRAADSPASTRPTAAAAGKAAARARRAGPADTNAARTADPVTSSPSAIVAGLLTATGVTVAATYPAATVARSSRDEGRQPGNDRTQWIRGPRCSANNAIGPSTPPWKLPRNQA